MKLYYVSQTRLKKFRDCNLGIFKKQPIHRITLHHPWAARSARNLKLRAFA